MPGLFDVPVVFAVRRLRWIAQTDFYLRDASGQLLGTATGSAGGRLAPGIEIKDPDGQLRLRVVRDRWRFWRYDAEVYDAAGVDLGRFTPVHEPFWRRTHWQLEAGGIELARVDSVGWRRWKFVARTPDGAVVAALDSVRQRELANALPLDDSKRIYGGGWRLRVDAPVGSPLRPLLVAMIPAMSAYAYDLRPRHRL